MEGNINTRNDISIESKINEAEVCRNMGLHREVIKIYEMVLAELQPQDSVRRDKYQRQVNLLQKEIENREEVNSGNLSGGDIGTLLDQLPAPKDPSSIFDKASAFQEMGLYQQAAAELFKLLGKDFPLEFVVPDLVENLLKQHLSKKTTEEFIRLLETIDLKNHKKAEISLLFGREMEKKDYREAAFEIYKAAHRLETGDADIKKALDAISSTFTSGSKYDYLLAEKLVTADQLQKAFSLSKKMNKSVEAVWIDVFHISKQSRRPLG